MEERCICYEGLTFWLRPACKKITSYHKVVAVPSSHEGLLELMRNGKVNTVSIETYDEPELTHFEVRECLENVDSTVWVFKKYTLTSSELMIFSDLPEEEIKSELTKMFNSLTKEEIASLI